jgi:hypothetical protein
VTEKRTIWKFPIEGMDPVLSMPESAEVVGFGQQDGGLVVWAIVDPEEFVRRRAFHVVGTGWDIDPGLTHRGMVQMPNGLVWHLLEEAKE